MKVEEILNEIGETLRGFDALSGVPVIVDDPGDVVTKLDASVAKCSVAVVVSRGEFAPVVQGPTAPAANPVGTQGITATVYEKPVVNRARPGRLTVLGIARTVADGLNGAAAKGMDAPLWLKKVGRVQYLNDKDGTVFCDIDFETKASLN